MASSLTDTTLQVNGTQSITGISTTLNDSDTEVPTSAAVMKCLISRNIIPRVGGVIFYIDSSSTNTYAFYDANGNQISAPTVGSDYTSYYYTKSGSDVDKFYVYYSTLITSKCWGYYNITTSATGNSIGAGKINTLKVLALTDTSEYASGSIWEYIKDMRTNKTNGCDDWFVGCPAEYNQLRSSGTTGADWFSSNTIWSSQEDKYSLAYFWYYGFPTWFTSLKYVINALVPIRAF